MLMVRRIFSIPERIIPLVVLALATAFATSPAMATLPGPTSVTFAKGVKFAVAGYAGASTLSGFPVLVRIAENSPSGFSYDDLQSKSTGADIAFVDMDGNGIPFEIDTWNTSGTSLIWVRLPSMTNGTEFVMCWGSVTSGKTVCPANPWSDFTGVWHMGDPGDGVTNVCDSTANRLDGTTVASSKAEPAGKIGGARFITSNTSNTAGNPYDSGVTVDLPGDKLAAVNSIVPEFTASFWVRPQHGPQWWYFITRKASDKGPGWGLQQGADNDFGKYRAYGGAEDDAGCLALSDVTGLAQGSWTKIDAVWMSDKKFRLYMNGSVAKQGTLTNQAVNGNQSKLALGGAMGPTSTGNKNGRGVYGDMDEIRLRAGALSDDWIAADYATQTDAAFLTAGMAQPYGDTDDPVAGVSVSDVSYTNATVTATVAKRGGAATTADVTVEMSAANDFASTFWLTNYTVSADDDVQAFLVTDLSVGTSYYVRAVVSNDLGIVLTTPATSFTMLVPGAPAGTAAFLSRGFSTMSATAMATDFGSGAVSATMRLEASTDADFATFVAGSETDATLGEPAELTISDLTSGTEYALRVRIRNEWGLDTFVALPTVYTRDAPFAATGIGWNFSADGSTIDISLDICGIYDGVTVTATLTYGGAPAESKSFSQAGMLLWSGLASLPGSATATAVLSAELDGRTYSQTFTATIAEGSTAVFVSDITEHASAETALRVHPGDVVTLPELGVSSQYILGNKLFASLDGNVLTALRPGIVGVHCIDNDSATNTLAVLVLPEKIGNGDIYVFKDSSVTGNWCYWNDPARWEKLGSETNDSWPHNPDDIAIVAFYHNTGVQFDSRADDVVLGGLYAGGYCDTSASISLRCVTKQGNVLLASAIRFMRSDGEPVIVQLCSNSMDLGNNQFRTTLSVADSVPLLEYSSDTMLSGGWDGTNARFPQGRFSIGAKTNAIPAGVTVELVEMDTQEQSMGCTLSITRLAGGGTFWNHSSATMRVYGSPLFSGLLRDSGGHGAGTHDRTAPTFVRTETLTNVAAEVVGWVGRSGSNPNNNFTAGVGALVSGWPHFYHASGPHNPWFPWKGVTMFGGLINNRDEESSDWIAVAETNIVESGDNVTTNVTVLATLPDKRLTDFLDVARGFVYLRTDCTSVNYPTTWFEAAGLRHGDKATLYMTDSRVYGSGGATNTVTILHGVSAYAIGETGDPATGSVYPIVPWIATQAGNKEEEDMRFAAFDGNGLIVPIAHGTDKKKSLSDYGTNDNAYLWEKGISLSADTTFHSLSIANDNYSKQLGEGRTLTLTSGGLILEDVSWMLGSSGIGTEDGGSANGTLVLGDAAHPAYVWARGADTVSEKARPNEIWAKVTAPGGFVSAYTGNLILGGNQTGIGGEIAVNAGALQLGTAGSACQLARNLPIRIYANATLRLPNAESTKGAIVKFDGAAGWFGKVEIPDGVAAKCWKAYWRDYPETQEWQNLKRGVYTGDEATALANPKVVYDPERFSGAGMLEVLRDDLAMPLVIRLK